MEAASRIRAARLAAGLTQAELAARSGVRQPNIAAYESGSRTTVRTDAVATARSGPSTRFGGSRAQSAQDPASGDG